MALTQMTSHIVVHRHKCSVLLMLTCSKILNYDNIDDDLHICYFIFMCNENMCHSHCSFNFCLTAYHSILLLVLGQQPILIVIVITEVGLFQNSNRRYQIPNQHDKILNTYIDANTDTDPTLLSYCVIVNSYYIFTSLPWPCTLHEPCVNILVFWELAANCCHNTRRYDTSVVSSQAAMNP